MTTPLPFDAELQKWKKKGIEPLQVNKMENPEHGRAYMDTAKLVGCITRDSLSSKITVVNLSLVV